MTFWLGTNNSGKRPDVTYLVRMTGPETYAVVDSEGNTYIHNMTEQRASEIAAAWNLQNYKGINDE